MNWRRAVAFGLLTVVLAVAFVPTIFLALMGDCPEHVISGWNGGTACTDHKRVLAGLILIGFPSTWLAGTIAIFRRWSR